MFWLSREIVVKVFQNIKENIEKQVDEDIIAINTAYCTSRSQSQHYALEFKKTAKTR